MSRKPRITVAGAGALGLTTALALAAALEMLRERMIRAANAA